MGVEGMYLNIMKAIYDKLTGNDTQWWKDESFSSKIRSKTRMPTLPTFIQYNIGRPR